MFSELSESHDFSRSDEDLNGSISHSKYLLIFFQFPTIKGRSPTVSLDKIAPNAEQLFGGYVLIYAYQCSLLDHTYFCYPLCYSCSFIHSGYDCSRCQMCRQTFLTKSPGSCGRTNARESISMLKKGSLSAACGMLTVHSGLQEGMNCCCVTEKVPELLRLSSPANPSEHSQVLKSKKGVIALEV